MEPLGIAFGISSAASWGTSDFAGGLASRSLGSVATAAAGQAIGLVAVGVFVAVTAESAPVGDEAAWALVAGLGGAVGLVSLYRALAAGQMGLVAPLTGAVGAGLPVVASFALGERVGPGQALGIACALGAVVVVSGVSARSGSWRLVLPLVVAAGGGFAVFYLAIDRSAAIAGHLWQPLLLARASSLAAFLGLAALDSLRGSPGRPGLRLIGARWPLLLAVGLSDLGGNAFFVLADSAGPLSIAVVLSSLYPVVTAVLARLVLGERLGRPQLAGALLAVAAIVLIAS